MATDTNSANVEFFDFRGFSVGILQLLALHGHSTICLLSPSEALENGEEAIQLLEGRSYEYQLQNAPGLMLQGSSAIVRSLLSSSNSDSGRIEPGSQTGLLALVLVNAAGAKIASTAVEVRSSKLDYRSEYRQMMEFITEKCTGLLLEIRAPSQARFAPSASANAAVLQQRFAFLKSVLDSKEFQAALHRIISMPHQKLEAELVDKDIRKGFKPGSSAMRQLASRTPRVQVPPGHPLSTRLATLPARIAILESRETFDTPENRFIKHSLAIYVDFLLQIEKLLGSAPSEEARLRREVEGLRERLAAELSKPFFKEISAPDILPLGSPVLQRKAGYKELLQAWLKFNLASRLIWSGGDDVYGAGKKDMAALYEYWLFFQMLDIASSLFQMEESAIEKLISSDSAGFRISLKSGASLKLYGRYASHSRNLKLRLSYNRTLSYGASSSNSGSWTRNMRPDYTFSFWPEQFSEVQAEEQELAVHIHFDAKYRADTIDKLFGDASVDLQAEKEEQRQGSYKRADLLKMHTYRDAIRRTAGSYVLYPGDKNKEFQLNGFHEILPGIGAFIMRPVEGGKATGTDDVSNFLKSVVEHLCDRASNREQLSYHLYSAYSRKRSDLIKAKFTENKPGANEREIPPSELCVLVGRYQNFSCLRWAFKNKLFCVEIGSSAQPGRLSPEMAGASYLLLSSTAAPLPGLWRVQERGPALLDSASLLSSGFPGTLNAGSIYAAFKVEPDPEFSKDMWIWDPLLISSLSGHASFASALPFVSKLDVILACKS